VVLTVTAAFQGGLDVPEDALDAGVISEAIASMTAAAVGSATVATVDSPLRSDVLDEGVSMATADFADYLITNAVTGQQTLMEGMTGVPTDPSGYDSGGLGENFVMRMQPDAELHPDIWDGEMTFKGDAAWDEEYIGTIGGESKVGGSFKPGQFEEYVNAASFGRAGADSPSGIVIKAAHYFFFENPVTGRMVSPSTLRLLTSRGVTWSVYFVEQVWH